MKNPSALSFNLSRVDEDAVHTPFKCKYSSILTSFIAMFIPNENSRNLEKVQEEPEESKRNPRSVKADEEEEEKAPV